MNTTRWTLIAEMVLALAVTGCVQTYVNLDYVPATGSIQNGAPTFQVGEFLDLRATPPPLPYKVSLTKGGFFGPNWETLGPKYLGMVSFEPVDGQTLPDYVFLNDSASNVVSRTVASALEARGMLAPASVRHVIVGEILELSVDTLTHQHAVATLRVSVKSAAGQLLYRKVYTASRQSLDHYPQAGDPVVSLRKLAGHALQDATDHALDDPEMRRVIR